MTDQLHEENVLSIAKQVQAFYLAKNPSAFFTDLQIQHVFCLLSVVK